MQSNFFLIKALTFVTFMNRKRKGVQPLMIKTKIIPQKVNSALNDCDVIANLKELHSNFVFVPVDKAANNAAICKRLFALLIAKQLEFNSGKSNDKDGTYGKMNSVMENDTINEHKEYLSNNYSIKRNGDITFNILDS